MIGLRQAYAESLLLVIVEHYEDYESGPSPGPLAWIIELLSLPGEYFQLLFGIFAEQE